MPPKKSKTIRNFISKAKLIAGGWLTPTRRQMKRDVRSINSELDSPQKIKEIIKETPGKIDVTMKEGELAFSFDAVSENEAHRRVGAYFTVKQEKKFREYSRIATDSALAAIGIEKSEKNKELIRKVHDISQRKATVHFYSSGQEHLNRIDSLDLELFDLIGKKARLFLRRLDKLMNRYGKYTPSQIELLINKHRDK